MSNPFRVTLIRGFCICFVSLLMLFGIAGCSTHGYVPFPTPVAPISITVSSDTVSTFSEVPAIDYLIPQSQVFYRLLSIGHRPPIAELLGINRATSRRHLEPAGGRLAVSFTSMLKRELSEKGASPAFSRKFAVVEAGEQSDLTLLPFATLVDHGDGRAGLEFEIVVRVSEGPGRNAHNRRYFYATSEIRPLAGSGEGWSDGEAAPLRHAANVALPRLLDLVVSEIGGSYPRTLPPPAPKFVYWRTVSFGKPASAAVMHEHPDYFVVGWATAEYPRGSHFGIVERGLVQEGRIPIIRNTP